MQGCGVPLALVLAIVLILAVLAGVLVLIVPKIADAVTVLVQSVAEDLNWIADALTVKKLDKIPFASVRRYLENIDWAKIEDQFLIWAKGISGTIADYLSGVVSSMAKGVGEFFVGIAFSIYILLRKETLKSQFQRLIYAWLPAKFGHGILHVFDVCSSAFQNFVTGQVTEAFILGSLCAIGMGILRLPYAPLIGALVGVTAIIPILGAFVSTVVGAFMIMMVSPVKAIIFVIFLLLLQQIEGNFIYPKVVGSKISLPAIWVFTAVTIGGKLCGPLGMLLGVPIMSAVYSLLKEATINRENKKQSKNAVDCLRTGDES